MNIKAPATNRGFLSSFSDLEAPDEATMPVDGHSDGLEEEDHEEILFGKLRFKSDRCNGLVSDLIGRG
jgi:hypothetical protein